MSERLAPERVGGQDREVSQPQRKPFDGVLDLFLYAPVGLVLTATEEIPKLAQKGRSQIESQVAIARAVGQFAVAQGRRQIERRFAPARTAPSGNADMDPGVRPGSHWSPAEEALGKTMANATLVDIGEERRPRAGEDGSAANGSVTPDGGAPVGEGTGESGALRLPGPSPQSPEHLAIPGYDSLSALQVVQRLPGLSPEELAAVEAYELAHRARRTILSRISQLRA